MKEYKPNGGLPAPAITQRVYPEHVAESPFILQWLHDPCPMKALAEGLLPLSCWRYARIFTFSQLPHQGHKIPALRCISTQISTNKGLFHLQALLLGKTTPVLDKEQPPSLCPGVAGLSGGPEQCSNPKPGWTPGRVNCREVELPICGSGILRGSHHRAWEGHRLEEGGGKQEPCPLVCRSRQGRPLGPAAPCLVYVNFSRKGKHLLYFNAPTYQWVAAAHN